MTARVDPIPDPAQPVVPRGRLFRKYVVSFVAVISVALIAISAIDGWFSYSEQKRLLIAVQREQANSAAAKIAQFAGEIERQIGWLALLPQGASTRDDVRIDAIRLLRLVPAIAEVAQLDSAGRELLRVSRHTVDAVGSQADLSRTASFRGAKAEGVHFGLVYFFRETEPYMTMAVAGPGRDPAVTVAEVNLRFIWDLVSEIKVGASGRAYVVDRQGRLVAHPDLTPVLRQSDVAHLAQVRDALSGESKQAGQVAVDLNGKSVLSVHATVPSLGWLVFVELPVDEAYASIYASALRSLILLLGLLGCAILAALLLSRRMTVPILALTRGAARIGSGDLEQQLAIKTGDELEALGEQFNRMATQLRESYATLEGKVIARTAELAQARDDALAEHAAAERARDAAELANETKSRFLGVVSHELRTPLNGLMGVLQLLDDGRLNAGQRHHLKTAAASGDTLLALIDGILEYARLDAGTEALEQRNFQLGPSIEAAVDLMRPQAEAKGLMLGVTLDPSTATSVTGDPVRLNRVLLNLLGNAIKFTAHGHVRVQAALDQGTSLFRLAVSDTGIGIAPKMQERIFEDFVQADDSIVRRFGGTGLGLAISRRLVRLMGGELTVESAVGAGSTFRLAVPLRRAADVSPAIASHAPSESLAVLLVDDDPVNRDVGAALLQRLGHRPTVAADGTSAIALARGGAFDAVLMDLHMPDMDGIAVVEQIRSLPFARMPQIIALTADVSERSRERIARAGIAKVVSKPVLLDALRAVLRDDARAHAAPAPRADELIDGQFLATQLNLLGIARLRGLQHLFDETSSSLLQTMTACTGAGDRPSLARAAHQLGSAASALGLARLFAHCTSVERNAASMTPDALHAAVAEFAVLRRDSLGALDARLRAPETSAALV
jgi:signal transduction histidine kinase/CheY-like chemotaxis protein